MVMIGGTFAVDEAVAAGRVVVVDERAVVRRLERDELAGVERRAAADRDEQVRAVRVVRGDAVEDVLLDGVRIDAVEARASIDAAASSTPRTRSARPALRTPGSQTTSARVCRRGA